MFITNLIGSGGHHSGDCAEGHRAIQAIDLSHLILRKGSDHAHKKIK